MLRTVRHLLGGKGDVHQVFAYAAGERLAEKGEKFFAFLLGQEGQGLVKLGDDLPVFVDTAAADVRDAGLLRPETAAQLCDFFFVHRDPLSS